MRAWITISIGLLTAAGTFAEEPLVVLAASRAGHIEVFDDQLRPLGTIGVGHQLESVTASPDGRRLYIAQESRQAPGGCCGLFSLDLQTWQMCPVASPALFGAPSPDGRFIFTQSSRGVEMFDAQTLSRLPAMKAPGAYNLQPSPDGRWLFGVTNSPTASLDIFDLRARALVRRLRIPVGPVTGAWAGDRFYLFSYADRGAGLLWSVTAADTEIRAAQPIELPDFYSGCDEPVLLMLAGAPDRLFLAEAFGFKVDRRGACPGVPAGGIYMIQPSSGNVRRIAESLHVNRMVATPVGGTLYVIHSSGRTGGSRLLRVAIEANGNHPNAGLEPGDWNLTLAHMPAALIPRGEVRAGTNCPH